MVAHLFEFRLFADEPALILHVQRDLLLANASLLRCLFPGLSMLVIPSALAFGLGAGLFDEGPLRVGEAAVLTAKLGGSGEPLLFTPSWLRVETPPVRVQSSGEMSWRIRPLHAGYGSVVVRKGSEALRVSVSSAHGISWKWNVHSRRWHREWLDINYPPARIFGVSWTLWFLIGLVFSAFAW